MQDTMPGRSATSPLASVLFLLIIVVGFFVGLPLFSSNFALAVTMWVIFFLLAVLVSISIHTAAEWDRATVLRLGKFARISGPGIFFIIPVFETIPYWIDLRTMSVPIKAEQTLTKDSVPVSVEAILFFRVIDAKMASLAVADYYNSGILAAQTALRDIIGKSELSTVLSERENIDEALKVVIGKRVIPWGIEVISVEMRDVIIPENLQNAMSQKAQSERERESRVILGDSERIIADSFSKAAEKYKDNPVALHLRAMNMLFEGLKEKGALMIVPSSALESMNLGSLAGIASLGGVKLSESGKVKKTKNKS
jgi:regulator of protease activity HflC (stomatin/prohibitin superfamily)